MIDQHVPPEMLLTRVEYNVPDDAAGVVLLVDIDGTVRDVWPAVCAHARTLTDAPIPDRWDDYDALRRAAGDEVADASFVAVCGTVDGWRWYPGAVDELRNLYDYGIMPVFSTLNATASAADLSERIAADYERPAPVFRVRRSADKLAIADGLHALGIVDDKPETLWQFRRAGFYTATLNHPYNAFPPVSYRFDDWRGADLLASCRDELQYRNRKGA